MNIIQAQEQHLDIARELFREYQTNVAQEDTNQCFQGFEEELAELPGSYSDPKGVIYIAFTGNDPDKIKDAFGCIAIRPRENNPQEAEIKRLFVRPQQRGTGAGTDLLNKAFLFAKSANYSSLFLETTASMQAAKKIYKVHGFQQIPGNDDTIECYRYSFNQDANQD